jgi:hypothetical protein
MSSSATATQTYSVADVEIVMRRVTADLVMIASSTGAITEEMARQWGHDVEVLAKNGYLDSVDLTLFSAGVEQKAVRFDVNTDSGNLTTSRPGGVLWPRVIRPQLQIVLIYSSKCDAEALSRIAGKLKGCWVPVNFDTSHPGLKSTAGRDYVSNGYGMQRKDFNQ